MSPIAHGRSASPNDSSGLEVGIRSVVMGGMSQPQTTPQTEIEEDLRPRARTLSWMASLSVAAGELRAAEGYLLELLAWCAFADRTVIDVVGEPAS